MSKTLRVVLAAIAAVLLVGLAPTAAVNPTPNWNTAGPDAPEGG